MLSIGDERAINGMLTLAPAIKKFWTEWVVDYFRYIVSEVRNDSKNFIHDDTFPTMEDILALDVDATLKAKKTGSYAKHINRTSHRKDRHASDSGSHPTIDSTSHGASAGSNTDATDTNDAATT